MTILIPSYEPDNRLLELIVQLKATGNHDIVVVDDGSGERYRHIFEKTAEYGCKVLTHAINLGKGRALKTGFQYMLETGQRASIICADSDGQHLPEDIMRIAEAVEKHPRQIVLGSRRFTGKVPLRSRFGNSATRMVYSFTTGTSLHDTQTGLRGFSPDMLDWLCRIPGDRFEYEMNMLLEAQPEGYHLLEIPIDTVYLDDNKSSHFRPVADSMSVYMPIVKFSCSSLFAALVDYLLLFLVHLLTSSLLLSVVAARLTSSIINYSMNRKFVFAEGDGAQSKVQRSLPRYFSLVLLILALNYGLLYMLHDRLSIALLPAKLLTESILFVLSYWAQRKFVY
ncbi:bifunctional glycosyltransferase family 2/GtrA family protein [Paenibacillus sp. MMS18-CY102]|uniref:bifunctional glycosyltransferase family 2/GtrA family protein n=1 Tax=Paenibacillus sp. MMS18-CY102 TaxID=2682849 RepID=UPI0013661304|nr:bifunctional glycosyltransferase family 2/GtrA family protein [Paenibacillus sp. MMS18-CY102]MWC26670.1 glycosyltransferase [Paenibacillus sp. MMS18-CY102]